jgi:hypothetical protein
MNGVTSGSNVFLGVRPEDVEVFPASCGEEMSGMLRGIVEASLFVGERVEYQIRVDGQGSMLLYGERHSPIDEGSAVLLKLRPEGHTAWTSDETLEKSDGLWM